MGGEIPPHNFGQVVSHDQSLNILRTINWPRWSHGGMRGESLNLQLQFFDSLLRASQKTNSSHDASRASYERKQFFSQSPEFQVSSSVSLLWEYQPPPQKKQAQQLNHQRSTTNYTREINLDIQKRHISKGNTFYFLHQVGHLKGAFWCFKQRDLFISTPWGHW